MAKLIYFKDWDEMPATLNTEQVAMICSKRPECIRKWAASGKIPATKLPDGWLFDKVVLREWCKKNGNAAMQKYAS